MAASDRTLDQVIRILQEEVGEEKALRVAMRLVNETTGNVSYVITVRALYLKLRGDKHYDR